MLKRLLSFLTKRAPPGPASYNLLQYRDNARIIGRFDVLGHPVITAVDSAGRELAVDYDWSNPPGVVPLDWVRAMGKSIDAPTFDGLMIARRFRAHVPVVLVGNDGALVIIEAKGAMTGRHGSPHWRPGLHVPLDEYRRMRRVREEDANKILRAARKSSTFKEYSDAMAASIVANLNEKVMDRYGGIDEDNLPSGLPPSGGYDDKAIEESKRAAAELIDRLAAPFLKEAVRWPPRGPLVIPKGVELIDYDDMPISIGNIPGCPFSCAAWDESPPRAFDPGSARRNGAPVSEAAWRALIESIAK